MYPASAVPANLADVDPWIGKLLNCDGRISDKDTERTDILRQRKSWVSCETDVRVRSLPSVVFRLNWLCKVYASIQRHRVRAVHVDTIYIAQPISDQLCDHA